jgi:putative copper export protein
MRDAALDGEAIRIFLHVVAVAVWVGGQIVLGAIVPALRRSNPDVLPNIAKAFSRVAWPAFAIAVFTGVWNMISVDSAATTDGWSAVLGIKMLLVVLSGVGAYVHQSASKPAIRGASAGIGLLMSLAAVLLGVMLSG